MKLTLTIVAIALLATGCASRPPLSRGIFVDRHTGTATPVTPLHTELRAEIGEPIWQSGEQHEEVVTMVKVEKAFTANLELGHKLARPAGATFTLQRRSFNGNVGICMPTSGAGNVSMAMSGQARAEGCLVDRTGVGRFDAAMFSMYEKFFPLAEPIPYTVLSETRRQVVRPQSVRQQLLYQGAGGGVLRLSYREFTSSDLARPSFTQDLTYDLGPDGPTEIGFRGLRMRVLSATNQGLTAIVDRGVGP